MHEISIVHAVLEQVAAVVPAGRTVMSVRIDVGQLEHLDEDVMRTAWRAMSDGAAIHGATLDIVRVPIRLRCRSCHHEYEPEDVVLFRCPRCRDARPDVRQGSGVMLRSIEVEDE